VAGAVTKGRDDATPEVGRGRREKRIRERVARRLAFGLVTVVTVAVIVYFATLILPGDAARAILGQTATPARLAILRETLGLNRPPLEAFLAWATAFLQGDLGRSLVQSRTVVDILSETVPNSIVLVAATAAISTVSGVFLGALAALRRDGIYDQALSGVLLIASAMPEFVVGIFLVIIFSVKVFRWFPAVSVLPPGDMIWQEPNKLVLPVLTLVLVTTPYVFRMVRGTMIEALNSDYAELATLKGVPPLRLLLRHALPNALPPAIQAVGLNLLYLAGGIVLVETVFAYPGVGHALVGAINARDIPVIQSLAVMLAIVYVLINITADVAVLGVTPRRRYPRA
jgi:peptide/nickel transport system permease protein